jgi:hypothetical protein
VVMSVCSGDVCLKRYVLMMLKLDIIICWLRWMSLSQGEQSLSKETWELACNMEKQRKQRINRQFHRPWVHYLWYCAVQDEEQWQFCIAMFAELYNCNVLWTSCIHIAGDAQSFQKYGRHLKILGAKWWYEASSVLKIHKCLALPHKM